LAGVLRGTVDHQITRINRKELMVNKLHVWWEETGRPYLILGTILVGLLLLIVGVPYLQFKAYQERFPEAPGWTFFFQGGRR
jgi:uncharacterized membrane protein